MLVCSCPVSLCLLLPLPHAKAANRTPATLEHLSLSTLQRRPSVGLSVGPSVGPSVGLSVGRFCIIEIPSDIIPANSMRVQLSGASEDAKV